MKNAESESFLVMIKGDEGMKRFNDPIVLCPYYKGDEGQVLYCEGVQKGCAIHLAFDTRENLKLYKKRLCKGPYNECLIAGALNRKWGYDGE